MDPIEQRYIKENHSLFRVIKRDHTIRPSCNSQSINNLKSTKKLQNRLEDSYFEDGSLVADQTTERNLTHSIHKDLFSSNKKPQSSRYSIGPKTDQES